MPEAAKELPFELEVPAGAVEPTPDRRPRIPDPLPVKLVAVADVRLPAPNGMAAELDAFYVKRLGFERIPAEAQLAYRAENFLLSFDIGTRPLPHETLRPLGVEVMSLGDTEKGLLEAEIEYTRQRGVTPGQDTLLLLDPAGNWIELIELRVIR